MVVCADDMTHEPRPLPDTCHLRYCPDCERRHQGELVAKYTPILKALCDEGSRDLDNWRLKKITITTPFALEDATAEADYQKAWEYFEIWQQLMLIDLDGESMSPREKQRARYDYKPHGYGSIVTAEYGEDGHHLHFHITAYCPYMPKLKTSDKWLEASGGRCLVTDVRKIDYGNIEKAVREQVKYVTKFSKLPPALVIKLAEVLDGARRVRTYGVVRGAAAPAPEPSACPICESKRTLMRVETYLTYVLTHHIEPAEIVAAAAPQILLDLKRGIKVGERGSPQARDAIPDRPAAAELPHFADVQPKIKPFRYD